MTATGSPAFSVFTDAPGATAGQYSLSGFGAGSYTVVPTKTGGSNNSITAFDAAKIGLHAAGVTLLTGNALVVADVSGDGNIRSFDAGEVARFAVGFTTQIGQSGNWIFSPANRTYSSVTADLTGEDYTALLMGDVSGNWTNTGARPARIGPERSSAVALPRLAAPADNEVLIPVRVDGVSGKGIIAYQFSLRYDPSVIQPQADPIGVVGTLSSDLSTVVNAEEPGLLRVAVYGTMPLNGDGLLLNLRFTAIGAPGSVSPLTWERFMMNEDPTIMATDGWVEVSAAVPN